MQLQSHIVAHTSTELTSLSRRKSRADIRRELERRGMTVRAWARMHGFNERLVHEVISGRKIGRWGQAHNIAVLLGLKNGVVNERG